MQAARMTAKMMHNCHCLIFRSRFVQNEKKNAEIFIFRSREIHFFFKSPLLSRQQLFNEVNFLIHSDRSICLIVRLICCATFQIFLHICSFLEASTLVHGLSLVCKQFYLILKDDSLWKARINHIWPDASYPLLRPGQLKLIALYALHDHSFCK